MYAIVLTGGKQYKVEPGKYFKAERVDANVGDVIKAQNGTAVYTEEEGWFSFDLTELVPGEGYMYQNTSNSIKQLTYTTKKTTSKTTKRAAGDKNEG